MNLTTLARRFYESEQFEDLNPASKAEILDELIQDNSRQQVGISGKKLIEVLEARKPLITERLELG